MMDEDLSAMPLCAEIRETLRAMIARGEDPLEVAEAAHIVAAAVGASVEGLPRTGAKLYAAASAMLKAADNMATSQRDN